MSVVLRGYDCILYIVFAFNYDNNYVTFMLGIRTHMHMHMRVISHKKMARIHHASCMVDVDGDGENENENGSHAHIHLPSTSTQLYRARAGT